MEVKEEEEEEKEEYSIRWIKKIDREIKKKYLSHEIWKNVHHFYTYDINKFLLNHYCSGYLLSCPTFQNR